MKGIVTKKVWVH